MWHQEEVSWLHKEITIYGKKVMQPRQVAYMARDTSLSYTYSHTKLQPEAWHPQVAQVKVCHLQSCQCKCALTGCRRILPLTCSFMLPVRVGGHCWRRVQLMLAEPVS